MALSETKICNLALSLSGNSRISSINDDGEKPETCKELYELTRDEVLADSGVNWRCAVVRTELTAFATDPDFGWEYQYQLPADVLRVISMVTDEGDQKILPWIREGDRILTDQDACYILYIKRLTDVTKFPPLLAEAIYTKLASKLAVRLSTNPQMSEFLLRQYLEVVLPKAKMANAEEGYIDNEDGEHTWSRAGRSYTSADYPLWITD